MPVGISGLSGVTRRSGRPAGTKVTWDARCPHTSHLKDALALGLF